MKARVLFAPAIVCFLVLALVLPVHGQGGIIVTGADTTRQVNVSGIDPGLGTAINSVRPRVVMENANSQRHEPLAAPSGALPGLLSQVRSRVTFQFANSNRHAVLTSPPGALQTLFGAVQSRVVFEAANSSRSATFSYPVELIGDSAPPQISAIVGVRQGSMATISWSTNEFATSTVLYGTQSGNLTQNVSDPLYSKQHQMALTGLTSGATYYYRVRSVDLSGNVAQSQERVLTAQAFLFMPLIRRSN